MRIADDLPELGLLDDDIVLVDRSLKPRRKDLVVIAMQADPELQIARFEHVHEDAELWGVVVHLIRKLRA